MLLPSRTRVIIKEQDSYVCVMALLMMFDIILILTLMCNFWISVSDLLDYITPDADMKAREAQKRARAKVISLFLVLGFNILHPLMCQFCC